MKPLCSYSDKRVGDVVRSDYRTAEVFRAFGINYCCEGSSTIKEECEQNNIDYFQLVKSLDEATRIVHSPKSIEYNKWRIDFLIEYIINIHHAYLSDTLPVLQNNIPENFSPEISRLLKDVTALVTDEGRHQEDVIFPYIRQIDNAHRRREHYGKLFVRTLKKPINLLKDGDQRLSRQLKKIRNITDSYSITHDMCAERRVFVLKLKELDQDLVQHTHLERNVLFPRAAEMEQELLQS